MADAPGDWRAEIEASFPGLDLPGEEFADHTAMGEFTKYLQSLILARDIDATLRVYEWVETRLETPTPLKRLLAIHVVMMIHFVGLTTEERDPFIRDMPRHMFQIWHGANVAFKTSELK